MVYPLLGSMNGRSRVSKDDKSRMMRRLRLGCRRFGHRKVRGSAVPRHMFAELWANQRSRSLTQPSKVRNVVSLRITETTSHLRRLN